MKKSTHQTSSAKEHSSKKHSGRERPKLSHMSSEESAPGEEHHEGNMDFSELSRSSENRSYEESARHEDEAVVWEESTTSGKPVEDVQNLLKELSESAVTALKNGENENALDYLKRSEQMLEVRKLQRINSNSW